ncbi:unnamed protein product [Closterium sp. NIES-54]
MLVVDDYTRYTTVFPLRSKADVRGVLIPWIHATRRQLCEPFRRDSILRQFHSLPSSTGLTPTLLCPPTDHSQPQLLPGSPLLALATHTERVALPSPPASSLPGVLDPESDLTHAANPTVTRLLATVVNEPDFESTAAFALVTELVEFAARSRLDYVASLVTESSMYDIRPLGVSLPLAGDPDALDIPTPHSYAEAIMALRDYELHSLDFSIAFLQGSLHKEIWLRCPPGFTGLFPTGTQWSLRRLVYCLFQAPREWHDTLRTTLAALGFAPSSADPSLFLRTNTILPPFFVLVYVYDLVFATADTEPLALVKAELQERHTCTNLGDLRSYLGLQITRDRAQRTITLAHSHMMHQVLQRFGFQCSSPQPTPLPTGHSLSAPPSDEFVEPSGPYPELVGCLIYEAEIYAGAMAAQELRWLIYLLTGVEGRPRSPPFMYVDNKAMLALCHEQRLEHRTKHIALHYFLTREL